MNKFNKETSKNIILKEGMLIFYADYIDDIKTRQISFIQLILNINNNDNTLKTLVLFCNYNSKLKSEYLYSTRIIPIDQIKSNYTFIM